MLICVCKYITEKRFKEIVEQGATTVEDLRDKHGISGQCGMCILEVEYALEQALETKEEKPT